MDWRSLGSLFCLELTLGVFVFLALAARAPVTPFFFRMNGGLALLPLIGAWWFRFAKDPPSGSLFALLVAGSAAVVIGYLLACGPVKAQVRKASLGAAVGGGALALAAAVIALTDAAPPWQALFILSAAASGLVVGGIGIAMAFGHHYLTVPDMDLAHFARMNGVTAIALLVKCLCLGALLLAFASSLQEEGRNLFRPMGFFHLGTRALVGLVMPLVFAAMVFGCLKHKATRSATGILYASTVLVILGEAMGLSLWGTYGVPL